MNNRLSVVIPTHRNKHGVKKLLADLLAQKDVHEVIVVANPHDENLSQYIHGLGAPFIYKTASEIGANFARNLGGDSATGDILLFLDDDCRITSSTFLADHVKAHTQYPDSAAIGGPYSLPARASLIARAYHWIADYWVYSSLIDETKTLHLLGGNWSLKKEKFQQFRFDDSIRFGGTESEMQLRMVKSAEVLRYEPSLQIEHNQNLSVIRLCSKGFQQGFTVGNLCFQRRSSLRVHASPVSFAQFIEQKPEKAKWSIRAVFFIYDQVFQSGKWTAMRGYSRKYWPWRLIQFESARLMRILLNLRYSGFLRDAYYGARFSVLARKWKI